MSTRPELRAGAIPLTRTPPVVPLVERFGLRMLVEACLVHEDGNASLPGSARSSSSLATPSSPCARG